MDEYARKESPVGVFLYWAIYYRFFGVHHGADLDVVVSLFYRIQSIFGSALDWTEQLHQDVYG